MESAGPKRRGLTTVLLAIEWTTIVAGVVATAGVFAANAHAAHSSPGLDQTGGLGNVPSACRVAPTTRSMLRAYLDGAELPAEPAAPEPALDDALRARGATLYAQHCATCHGEHGNGNGPTAAQLDQRPLNLTLGVYELHTTEHEELPADIDLFRTITRGIHGTGMPPWFALPERDRWALVAHLKTLSTAFQDDEAPPPIAIPSPPASTPERIAAGRQLFATVGCTSCHGADGRGDGPAAASLVDKSGAPDKPRDLRAGRYHRGSEVADIYTTIVVGFDGTPMASFAKVLSADQLWNVAIYVHSIAPALAPRPNGMRCPITPSESPFHPDELVGMQTLVHSLHPTN